VQPSTRTIEFSPAEREAFEERQRQWQATLERIAAAPTLEEGQRIGDAWWREHIEQPRAARRIETARRLAPAAARPTRPGRVTVKRRARATRTTTPSRGDPDDDPHEPDPFDRPLDQLLEGLRWHARDAYRLIPGELGEPDRWRARCPLHPDAGFTLLLTELSSGEVDLWCRTGCPEGVIRYALVPDPEREREAERRAAVLLWAQSFKRRRAS
jgi:hypothetical protein